MKKIWNADSQQHAYAIDENVMHEKIIRKKHGSSKTVNRMEWILMIANVLAGTAILVKVLVRDINNPYLFAMVAVMYLSTAYIFWRRQVRLRDENQFDRTMLGDLDHAIRNATYRERLSLLAFGYAIPFFILIWVAAYHDDKSIYYLIGIPILFIITILASVIEHRTIHMRYRKRLVSMKKMLVGTK
ncbi:MAG: hypothetical protein RIC35_09915 [Marinoscillum sp.]